MSTIEADQPHGQVKSWGRRLRSIGLPGGLVRELFSVLLLLRWADYQEAEDEAMAVFDDRKPNPVLPHALRWRHWCNLPPEKIKRILGDELSVFVAGLRSTSEKPLAAYLSALSAPLRQLARIDSHELAGVVNWVVEQPLESRADRSHQLAFFEWLITQTTEGPEGQFVSPADIARLVAAMADPRPGDRIYDPCFGSGGFLTAAWQHATRETVSSQSRNETGVFGVEINPTAYVVGLTRLILAGVPEPHLECGNSLEREPAASQHKDGFDVVLANPPIGMRLPSEPWQYQQFPIRTKDSTGLFVQHALQQLRPSGRAVLVIPEGFLFRTGPEQDLRRYLVEAGHLEAVVGLPAGAFAPYTMVRGSLLLLRKDSHPKRVHMMDATPLFERGEGRKKAILPSDKAVELAALVKSGVDVNAFFGTTPEALASVRRSSKHFAPVADIRKIADKPSANQKGSGWSISPEELAALDWDLSPRRRERGELQDLLAKLQGTLQGSGEIAALSNCAEILPGRSFPATDLVEQPVTEEPAVYVRIKDIQKSVASKGSHWISPKASHKIEIRWRLLAGDVLLSKSGTIGKVGIVRNGAVGGVATSGLYVIRVNQDRIDPGFLLAYLSSSECQNWLNSQSRGAVIQHLNRSTLEQLPVPLPPLWLQGLAAVQHREQGTDVLDFLTQALGASETDPIGPWLAEALRRFPPTLDAISEPLALLALVGPLASSIRVVRNRASHGEGHGALMPWVLVFAEALAPLWNASDVPVGAALLNLVQESRRRVDSAQTLIRGQLPLESQARRLSEILISTLDRVSDAFLSHVGFEFIQSQNTILLGERVEVVVWAENASTLPLRDIVFVTSPDWGVGSTGYLADGENYALHLTGEAPKVEGVFSLTVEWSARTLSGEEVSGDKQVSFDVIQPARQLAATEDLGSSPYVTGTPVYPERNDVFFGREALLNQIARQVAKSGNVVLLEGNRRAGKTSVLRHLEGLTAIPGWLVVYCSLQGVEGSDSGLGVPTAEVFRGMAVSIAKALPALKVDVPLPNGTTIQAEKPLLGVGKACHEGISDSSPFNDFQDYLEVILHVLEEVKIGLVIMLDEFDKLQDGIDRGITSPQVPENIRFLVQSHPRFSAILTGSRRLKRLREEYWSALYGLGTRFGVTALEVEDARRLVTDPVKGKLTFSPEATDRAITVTARQPYLLQCLCNRIFDFAEQVKTRSITLDAVEQASTALVKDNEHFASLWQYAGSDRRRLILMLCSQRSGVSELLTFGEMQELLLERGVEVTNESLEADLMLLRELELIDLVGSVGEGHYQLTIPLMGAWITQQHDFSVVQSNAQTESEEENA